MAAIKYKQKGRIGLFDKEETSAKLSKLGNPLEKIRKAIEFETFRPVLEANLLNQNKKNNAGCKRFDVVMMFKIILLKRLYHLSDRQAEYQIHDRLSFKEFLGLSSGDRIPNTNTIRTFQNKLKQNDLGERLIEYMHEALDKSKWFIKEGKIRDANLVRISRRRT